MYASFGPELFFSDMWNIYDFVIVMLAVLEWMLTLLSEAVEWPVDATVARLVRVLRVFRFFRLVTAFQSLNKLVVALYESVMETLWVGILTVLLLYMVGCLMTTAIGQDPDLQQSLPRESHMYFGTVQRSMLTLLQIMTLDGWSSEVSRSFFQPEGNQSPMVAVGIIIFMIFSALILMNLLAAIYVDKLLQLTNEDNNKLLKKRDKERRELMERLKAVFLQFDNDGNGVLTENELKAGLREIDVNGDGQIDESELQMKFREAGLSQRDLHDLMHYLGMLSKDQARYHGGELEIDYESFLNGIFSMNNPSTRKDTVCGACQPCSLSDLSYTCSWKSSVNRKQLPWKDVRTGRNSKPAYQLWRCLLLTMRQR